MAGVLTILLCAAVAAGLWVWPWQADGAIAAVVAGAWCGWLNRLEQTR